jgi:hypothetical protein
MGTMCSKPGLGMQGRMKSGSYWSQITRSLVVFVIVGGVAAVIFYFNGQGPHHHKANLVVAIAAGAISAVANFIRSRARRAGHDPAYNLGRQLRAKIDADRGQGGQPVPQAETQSVSETEPRHPG